MNHDEIQLAVVRGVIAGLPESDQTKIKEAAEEIRAAVAKHGEHGTMGLALVGAETAVKELA